MELEFHQLELRYERLKVVRPEQERRLLASLAEVGQQVPIVVVKEAGEGPFVVIDGYKRIRALRRLGRDTVGTSCWPGEEAAALIATRLMQTAEPETALEQSWLLAELHERFGLSLEELARRFSHSVSWVSRRLALVQELPESIQERVRRGGWAPTARRSIWCPWRAPTGKSVWGWRKPSGRPGSRAATWEPLHCLSDRQLGNTPAPAGSAAALSQKLQGDPSRASLRSRSGRYPPDSC